MKLAKQMFRRLFFILPLLMVSCAIEQANDATPQQTAVPSPNVTEISDVGQETAVISPPTQPPATAPPPTQTTIPAPTNTPTHEDQLLLGAESYQNNCAACHGIEAEALTCVNKSGETFACAGPPLNDPNLLCGKNAIRLVTVGWTGSKYDYIYTTISAGEGSRMPSFSEAFGGFMDDQEIHNLTNYILNFENESLCAPPALSPYHWPDTFAEFTTEWEIGDIERGEALYTITYGCAGCHGLATNDEWAGIAAWVRNTVAISASINPDRPPEEFIYESILYPQLTITEGYIDGIMPRDFALRMAFNPVEDPQDMQDIISYIMSIGEE